MSAARTVLAIETSCDETGAAVVRGGEVLSNVVASQLADHAGFGGVVPEVASRLHLETIDDVVKRALDEAHGAGKIDAVAATRGPGLIGALLVGLAHGKALAYALGVDFIAVDHLAGHAASVELSEEPVECPYLCLLVTGGHTLLLQVEEGLRMRLLGSTRDDAAGEAFDKGARLLGLGMPGGPAIERAAALATGESNAVFTPAMVHQDTLDTSFAGIKTALAVHLRDNPQGAAEVPALAAAYQHAIVETLVACVRKALRRTGIPRLAVVGGVAANAELRAALAASCHENDAVLHSVPLAYCSDNAAMIGVAASRYEPLDPAQALHIDAYATSPLLRTGEYVPTHAQ